MTVASIDGVESRLTRHVFFDRGGCFATILALSLAVTACAPRPLFESTVAAGDDAFECAIDEARSRGWSTVDSETYPDDKRAVLVRNYPGTVVQERLVVIATRESTPRRLTIKLTGKPFVTPAGTTGGAAPGTFTFGGQGVAISKQSRASEESTRDAEAILVICSV